MGCVSVNSMLKVQHSGWTVLLWVDRISLQLTVCGRYCTAGGQWYCGLNGVCKVNIMWKELHSRWTVLL